MLPWIIGGLVAIGVAVKALSSDDSSSNNSSYDEAERKEYEKKQKRRKAYIKEFEAQMKEKYDGEITLNPHFSCIFGSREPIKSVNSAQCTSLKSSIAEKRARRKTLKALLDKLDTLYFEYTKPQVSTQINADLPIKDSKSTE